LAVPEGVDLWAWPKLHFAHMPRKRKANPRGPWTAEEIARNERVAQIRVQQDRARGVSANLEDLVKLTRFANRFAEAFRHARGA
jgi:hypothetical protein